MGLIVRPFPYIAGNIIISAQNTANETTLYTLVNGNLTDDNLGTVTESAITFGASGHQHGGTTDGAKIALSQSTSGDDYLISCHATDGHAIKGSSAQTAKGGLYGTATASDAYGAYITHTQSASVACLIDNPGFGTALTVENEAGASDHAMIVNHNSTAANQRGLQVNVATGAASGIEVLSAGAVTECILASTDTGRILSGTISNVASTDDGIHITHEATGTAAGLSIDMAGAANTSFGIYITNNSTNPSATGIAIPMAAGAAIVATSTGNHTANFSSSGTGAYSTVHITRTGSPSGVDYGALFADSSAVSNHTCATFKGNVTSDTGPSASDPYVVRILNTAGTTQNALFVQGDIDKTGGVGFLEKHPEKPDKWIRFTCLEGPEAGTYWRTSCVVGVTLETRIPLMKEFDLVTHKEELTVLATPKDLCQFAAYHDVEAGEIVVKSNMADVEFSVVCFGVRVGYKDREVVIDREESCPDS